MKIGICCQHIMRMYIETRGNWVLIQPGGCPHEGSCIIWHPTRTKRNQTSTFKIVSSWTIMNYQYLCIILGPQTIWLIFDYIYTYIYIWSSKWVCLGQRLMLKPWSTRWPWISSRFPWSNRRLTHWAFWQSSRSPLLKSLQVIMCMS